MGKLVVFVTGYLFWPIGAYTEADQMRPVSKETAGAFGLCLSRGLTGFLTIVMMLCPLLVLSQGLSEGHTMAQRILHIVAVLHLVGYAAYLFCKHDRETGIRIRMSNRRANDNMTTM